MKLREIYWRVDVTKSHIAGIANKNLFILIYLPCALAYIILSLKPSGSLLLIAKKAMSARNSPKNIVIACMYG